MKIISNSQFINTKCWFDGECLERKKLLNLILKDCKVHNFSEEKMTEYNKEKKIYQKLLKKKKDNYKKT